MPKEFNAIPLVAAAARAKIRYARMLDHVLCGNVSGRQKNGRWVVDADDLERFLAAEQGGQEKSQAA